MQKYARLDAHGEAVEIFTPPEGETIDTCFHPEVAAMFVACPDDVVVGSQMDARGNWTPPPPRPTPTAAEPRYARLAPLDFYMAFTPAERVAIKASADAQVQEFWETFELTTKTGGLVDPNLVSVRDGLQHLRTLGILATDERVSDVMGGVPQ